MASMSTYLLLLVLFVGISHGVVINTQTQLENAVNSLAQGGTLVVQSVNPIQLNRTLRVTTPSVTIKGLNLKAQPSVAYYLVEVTARNVSITDFTMVGNKDTVPNNKGGLMIVKGDACFIARGVVRNSAKNGVTVGYNEDEFAKNITGGTVTDITGYDNRRDTVSIQGSGQSRAYVRYLTVSNLKVYRGGRGASEISDGTVGCTVKNVYIEDSEYGVDVQDHGFVGQSNYDATVQNLTAVRCGYTIRTGNHASVGHYGLTLSMLKGSNHNAQNIGLSVTNTVGVHISDISSSGAVTPFYMNNCDDVTIERISDTSAKGTGLQFKDSRDITLKTLNFPLAKPFMYFDDCARVTGTDLKSSGKIKVDSTKNYNFQYSSSLVDEV